MNWSRKNADLLIVSGLTLISLAGLYKKYDYGVAVEFRNYFAYLVILAVFVLRIFKVRRIKIFLGIALIFGTFNAIQFTHSDMFMSFSVANIKFFGFQPVSFFALLGLIILDIEGTKSFLKKIFPGESEKNRSGNQNALVENFKNKYKDYSTEQLKEIVDHPDVFQESAVKAARELLVEK
jgi:hypothetical protein